MSELTLKLDHEDEFIPAVSPPGGAPGRTAPTTQVLVTVEEWPGNVVRLWAPENVGGLWRNWDSGGARQGFSRADGGLTWRLEGESGWTVETRLRARGAVLTIETLVDNGSDVPLSDVSSTNCVQFRRAPDFACDDFSRIYIRVEGEWSSLASLRPGSDYPHYLRQDIAHHDGRVGWGGSLSHLFESVRSDHPLMVCVSRDGRRAVATASSDYEHLFHNRANPELLCIHSSQHGVPEVAPGRTAAFVQHVYFVEGGVRECVKAFESDGPPESSFPAS
jgi:hypothetical protein